MKLSTGGLFRAGLRPRGMAVRSCSTVPLAILFFITVQFAIIRRDGTRKFYRHIVCKIYVFENAKEPGQNFWTPLYGLVAERCGSHCCRLRLRGKGYFASCINRYTNSSQLSFQLVRLVISGSICPNPGPDKTFVSTKPDKPGIVAVSPILYTTSRLHF